MVTKSELIEKLKSRKVLLTSGKWVIATGFNWNYWKISEVQELFDSSISL